MTVVRLTLQSPRGLQLHWVSLVGTSLLLHLGLLVGIIVLPRVFRPSVKFPDVYTVNLVSLPAGAPGPSTSAPPSEKLLAPAPPASAPKAASKPVPTPPPTRPPLKIKPAIKIPVKPITKPAKPKVTSKAQTSAKSSPEETKAEPASKPSDAKDQAATQEGKVEAGGGASATPATGLASGGSGSMPGAQGGGGAGGLLDDATFQYGWYLSNMSSIFSRNWTRPIKPDLAQAMRAVVHFRIQKDGRLADIVLEQSSGDTTLDRSAIRAVQDSNPLPPLPYQYGKDSLGVHFYFDLVPD